MVLFLVFQIGLFFFGFFVEQNTEWLKSTGVFFFVGGGADWWAWSWSMWHFTYYDMICFFFWIEFSEPFFRFFLHIFLGMRGHNLGAVFFLWMWKPQWGETRQFRPVGSIRIKLGLPETNEDSLGWVRHFGADLFRECILAVSFREWYIAIGPSKVLVFFFKESCWNSHSDIFLEIQAVETSTLTIQDQLVMKYVQLFVDAIPIDESPISS